MTTSTPDLHGRLTAFIARLEVRHLRYPVRWRVTDPDVLPVTVTLIGGVLDRDTGAEVEVLMSQRVEAWWTDDALVEFFLGLLRDFLRHEAAEAFHVDGVRVRDPHLQAGMVLRPIGGT